ncbi:rCG21485 [Rattus norvegicus]|uniref:RCG21485 n=1 Tax=Rattus norvegicus TaxID=10116 RepID=A6J0V2_RAT|nr:rCG21485 [Rattus norvegicus]
MGCCMNISSKDENSIMNTPATLKIQCDQLPHSPAAMPSPS